MNPRTKCAMDLTTATLVALVGGATASWVTGGQDRTAVPDSPSYAMSADEFSNLLETLIEGHEPAVEPLPTWGAVTGGRNIALTIVVDSAAATTELP